MPELKGTKAMKKKFGSVVSEFFGCARWENQEGIRESFSLRRSK